MGIRGLCVAGLVIIFGFLFYGNEIFSPNMWPSQFLFSGVTLGIANAFFHGKHYRNGVAALLVWYMVSLVLISHVHDWWNAVLYVVYLAGIAGSVYLFYFLARQPFLARRYQKIIVSSILVGLTNSLIIVLLGFRAPRWTLTHLGLMFDDTYLNLKIGVLMGLLFGFGNLASDSLATYIRSNQKIARRHL